MDALANVSPPETLTLPDGETMELVFVLASVPSLITASIVALQQLGHRMLFVGADIWIGPFVFTVTDMDVSGQFVVLKPTKGMREEYHRGPHG